MSTSAAPVRAQTAASSGSRRPLTSLTIAAPAAIAASATAGWGGRAAAARGAARPPPFLHTPPPPRDRRLGARRLVRVDRHERTELAGDALHERHDALELLGGRDRRPPRDPRFAADVD